MEEYLSDFDIFVLMGELYAELCLFCGGVVGEDQVGEQELEGGSWGCSQGQGVECEKGLGDLGASQLMGWGQFTL